MGFVIGLGLLGGGCAGQSEIPPQSILPPPAALAVGRDGESGRIDAIVTLPQGDVAGVLTRRAVGRCPDRPTGVAEGRQAAAGAIVRVDVTPRGTLVGLGAQTLCVSAWTYDPNGRISAEPATQQFGLAPAGP
ncbi:MAG TPA: hypothetical protein PKD63_00510 [Solirubrobacteraceae bacterium]|nr:hypothetical protein [Solirubrobacteraceae bacterium]